MFITEAQRIVRTPLPADRPQQQRQAFSLHRQCCIQNKGLYTLWFFFFFISEKKKIRIDWRTRKWLLWKWEGLTGGQLHVSSRVTCLLSNAFYFRSFPMISWTGGSLGSAMHVSFENLSRIWPHMFTLLSEGHFLSLLCWQCHIHDQHYRDHFD